MLPVNFNQLYYFWVIAKERSISSAKDKLFLTQSTLSVQLQKLEKALEKKLFVRGRHGVVLTEQGRLAFTYCDRIFGQAAEFVRELDSHRPLPPPPLKLGVSPPISHGITMSVVHFIKRAGLNQRVQINLGGWDQLKARLIAHKVDLAITDTDFSRELGPDYGSRHVARLPMWFVGGKPWLSRLVQFPEGLSKAPFLLRMPDNPVRKEVDHFLWKRDLRPVIAAELEDTNLIRAFLLKNEGIAAMDLLSVSTDFRAKRLFKLHPDPLPFVQNVWFLFRRHHRDEPVLQKSLDIIRDTFHLTVPMGAKTGANPRPRRRAPKRNPTRMGNRDFL
jgi:LysR family transcriptional activator of nhaA